MIERDKSAIGADHESVTRMWDDDSCFGGDSVCLAEPAKVTVLDI
jgi:hypothetical protein